MKIAILTQPLKFNYGGILQCYALQTVLERMGHNVKVLSKPRYERSYYVLYPFAVLKRLFKRFVLGKKISILEAPHQIVRQHTDRFISRYIHKYIKRKWNSKLAFRFDVFIVGSDQVWRPAYSQPIEEAFLSFLDNSNVKRLSYAASFGVDNCDEYTPEQLRVCSELLKKFVAVSVREFSGIELCKNFFGVEAFQVLDPTLLLTANDYRYLVNNAKTYPSEGNMLVYMLDTTEEKKALINRIAEEKGLIPFWMNSDIDDENKLLEERIKTPVEQWLRSFDDAEFVLTDSFHGCVFSIIFSKQFIVIGNEKRGLSRFTSILEEFSLSDRLLLDVVDYEFCRKILDKKIDFDFISNLLERKRLDSIDYIKSINSL